MENKQTAVEWLQESMLLSHEQQMQFEGLFQQAISIEKGQIMDAYCEGVNNLDNIEEGDNIDWVGYYNKTYGKYL